ncbi:MAG: hypothetical protein VXY51_10580, partial [Pseudomonadota bacterium]|nr:hypothetical protein [Pseudomonadota bacterium]
MALTDLTRISTSGIATGTSLSGAILHGDAHFRGTQVGVTSALFDSSDNALEFNNDVKLKFANTALQIYHGSNVSHIAENGTGPLRLSTDEFQLMNSAQNKTMIYAAQNLAVSLNYNGNTKIQTTNTGAVVTGILTATSFSGPILGSPINNPSGISTFYDVRVSNNLTVEGSTTTLDTNLIGVDRVEVGANSNSIVGVAVTQSGTADLVNLFDGATKVVTVDDTGKVGLGTDNPGALLNVYGSPAEIRLQHTGNSSYSRIISDSSNELDFYTGGGPHLAMTIDGSQNVGIGTDNPLYPLHVKGATTNTAPNATGILMGLQHEYAAIQLNAADTKGSLIDFSVPGQDRKGGIQYFHSNNPTTANRDAMVFYTNGTNERIRISSNGRIGIGTDTDLTATVSLHGFTNPNAVTIKFENRDSSEGIIQYFNGAMYIKAAATTGDKIIQFQTSGSPRLTITSDGKVGIGTNLPQEELTIMSATPALMLRDSDQPGSYTQVSNANQDMYFSANGASAHANFIFRSGNNGSFEERVRIKSDGKVGIGDNSPDRELVVKNASSNSSIKIEASNAHTSQLLFSDTDAENVARIGVFHGSGQLTTNGLNFETGGSLRMLINSSGRIQIGNGSGVNASAPMELQVSSSSAWGDYPEHITLVDQKAYNAADNGAGIQFGGKYNNAGNATTFGSIHGKKATTGDGNFGGILTFNTREHGNSNFERMRIDSLGRVFINSVGPTTPTADYRSLNLVAHAHSEAGISFSRSHTTMGSGSSGGYTIVMDQTANLLFNTHNVAERMRIDSSGRVVVGGTSAYVGGANLAVMGTGTTQNTYGSFAIGKIGANPTAGTTLANIRLNGGQIGTRRGAEINAVANGNWTDGSSHPTKLTFAVANTNSASATERYQINHYG